MKVTCVVPSAGRGKRLKAKEPKPFVMLAGRPILAHTLRALERSRFIDDIIVVVSRDKLTACRRLVKKYKLRKVRAIVSGGKRRFDSVKNGLRKVKDADFVLIHDGARPFVGRDLIKKTLSATKRFGGAISATPSRQTLKSIGGNFFVTKTPKRKFLWEAQTPQAFRKDLIISAYKKAKDRSVTDDSSLVEKMGHRVKIVEGSHGNIKITTREDLELARILFRKCG
jgi:2-C-methyl-D-erythritol 4-phosphate cytidylyltransferase